MDIMYERFEVRAAPIHLISLKVRQISRIPDSMVFPGMKTYRKLSQGKMRIKS
jgi:hypothetical protein